MSISDEITHQKHTFAHQKHIKRYTKDSSKIHISLNNRRFHRHFWKNSSKNHIEAPKTHQKSTMVKSKKHIARYRQRKIKSLPYNTEDVIKIDFPVPLTIPTRITTIRQIHEIMEVLEKSPFSIHYEVKNQISSCIHDKSLQEYFHDKVSRLVLSAREKRRVKRLGPGPTLTTSKINLNKAAIKKLTNTNEKTIYDNYDHGLSDW